MFERRTLSNVSNNSGRNEEKSAADVRKSNKPLLEKKRRARINRSLEQLKNILIDVIKSENASGYSKLEKADILEMTVKHLKQLQRDQTKGSDSGTLLRYKAGFNECAKEVDRFMSSMENGTSSEIRHRLISHLAECSRSTTGIAESALATGADFKSHIQLAKQQADNQPQNWVLASGYPGSYLYPPAASSVHLSPQSAYGAVANHSSHFAVARECSSSDVENFHGNFTQPSRQLKNKKQQQNNDYNNNNVISYNSPYHHHNHQQQNQTMNSSFTISSTSSPFQQKEEPRILRDCTKRVANTAQQLHRSAKRQKTTTPSSSPTTPSSTRSSPYYSPSFPSAMLTPPQNVSKTSSDDHSSSFDTSGNQSLNDYSCDYHVKAEPVWRPW